MVHDHLASTANMARGLLMGLDRSALNTTLPTATLQLLLETVINLSAPSGQVRIADGAKKTVLGQSVQLTEAHKTQVENGAAEAARRY